MKLDSVLERIENIPVNVTKMHILVHPGYLEDVKGKDPKNTEKGKALFEKYKKLAKSLPKNEIMVILVHNLPEKFSEDHKNNSEYVKNIKSIREELLESKQAIILTSFTVPFSGADEMYDSEALNKIKSIAQNRGYQINSQTTVEIFGETHDECVQEAFLGITNTDFFDKSNISIIKELTDKA